MMDRETATKIRDMVQDASDRIRSSVETMRGTVPDDAFENYCKVVGVILTDIQLELLRPHVYIEFPELEPKLPEGPERHFIESLKPKFREAAEKARRDSENS